jgi:hypothetical protein
VVHRAWPWTELIHRYRFLPNDLNLRSAGRMSAVCLLCSGAAIAATPWWGHAWIPASAAALVVLAANRSFYRFLWRKRGLRFAVRAVPLHWLYLLYSAATFAIGTLWWWIRRPPVEPAPVGQDASDSDSSRAE